MKKQIIISQIIGLCLFGIVGCGNAIPEMDEATQEMVVEYAAAAVRKYNAGNPEKLLSYAEVQPETDITADIENENETVAEPEKQEQTTQPEAEVEVIEQIPEENLAEPASLETLLQLEEEITLSYEGYETKAYYPDNGEELFFVMNATEGNQLLILKFKAQNLSQADKEVNLLDKGMRYKIVVDGETKNALTTMLLNDMSNYQGMIAGGTGEELVLICEVPESSIGQLGEVSLIVKSADETTTILLN